MVIATTPRLVNGSALLDLTGRLTAGAANVEDSRLRTEVAELAAAGCAEIALNLAGLIAVDARGLGELVLALRTARERGGRLTLVAPPPRVRRMLAITRLDTVFDVCSTETEFRARSGTPRPVDACVVVGAQAAYA
ncbi:MAG: STAS domain-containing protein [Acidobacteria bacterium]|nr:STAS domain-containing protein [Acidobacteriota bacterium]